MINKNKIINAITIEPDLTVNYRTKKSLHFAYYYFLYFLKKSQDRKLFCEQLDSGLTQRRFVIATETVFVACPLAKRVRQDIGHSVGKHSCCAAAHRRIFALFVACLIGHILRCRS